MFSIKDDLMVSPKVIFFTSVLLSQPEAVHPLFPTNPPLPFIRLTHPSITTPPQRTTHQKPASGSANDRWRTFQCETSTPDHHKLEPFPP